MKSPLLFASALSLLAIGMAEIPVAPAQTVSSTSVNAAIDRWSKENSVIVTTEVRKLVAGGLAYEFTNDAREKGGLETVEAWHLGGAIADGGAVEYQNTPSSSQLRGKDAGGKVIFYANAPPRAGGTSAWDWVLHLVDYTKIGSLLQKYPQVHIIVQPVPPRDYLVKINGSTYEATEPSLYGVAPHVTIMVRVERSGKPPCEWSGIVSADQVQMVDCTL